MKLLFACTDCTPTRGGISRYNDTLVHTLQNLGWEVEVRALSDDTGASSWRIAALWSKVRFAIKVVRHLLQTPDAPLLLGHVNLWPVALAVRVLMRRRPVILLVYGIEAWAPPSRLRAWALRTVHWVWAISDYTRRTFAHNFGVPAARISVLYGTQSFPEAEGAHPASEPFGLTVCRMDATEGYKGVDTLLWALVELPFYRWVFVGHGSDRDRMIRMATELGLRSRVSFLKGLTDSELADLYQRCRLFALPSAKEGLGLVYLEALSYAKPVIAGAHAGALEITPSSDGGRQVAHGDVKALAEAIRGLWPRQIASKEGEAGLRWAAESFGAKAYQQRVAEALAQSLRSHHPEREGLPCAES